MDPFLSDNALNFWLQAQQGSVVLATTRSVGPEPAGWAGFVVMSQALELEVEELLAGPNPGAKLQLDVPVVQGARTSASTPGLAAWISKPGGRAVYFLRDGQLLDEDLGAVPPDQLDWLRQTVQGDGPPTGLAGKLHVLIGALGAPKAFSQLDPVVIDLDDGQQRVRVTLAGGALRLFSGQRYQRVQASRVPDATFTATAEALEAAMLGVQAWPGNAGAAAPFLAALQQAAVAMPDAVKAQISQR